MKGIDSIDSTVSISSFSISLAKEASSSSDRVQSEYYYQFTDHYYRLMLELGITLEENEIQEDKSSNLQITNSTQIFSENNNEEEKKEINKDEEENLLSNEIENEDIESVESIESIPFISKAPKKKTTRVKKIPV